MVKGEWKMGAHWGNVPSAQFYRDVFSLAGWTQYRRTLVGSLVSAVIPIGRRKTVTSCYVATLSCKVEWLLPRGSFLLWGRLGRRPAEYWSASERLDSDWEAIWPQSSVH